MVASAKSGSDWREGRNLASDIVIRAEAMFDLSNEHFYNNQLERPSITVSSNGGRGTCGWCSVYEIRNDQKEAYREINICAEYIDRPITEVAATMLHEMAHLYNLVNGIKDVSNNGYYHNKQFKATAEAHGLCIAKHPKYGRTITTPASETADRLMTVPGMEDIKVSRKTLMQAKAATGGVMETGEEEKPKHLTRTITKNRNIKYVCPDCGAIIRANKVINVICGECMVAFVPEIK